MSAFALTILLFAFWLFVGYGVTTVTFGRCNELWSILLAPVFGILVTLLPLFWLNRQGLPVGDFGPALAVGLVALSAILIWRFHGPISWRGLAPFGVVTLVALFVTGWPMFRFGFAWLGYANDDMANYALFAQRLLLHGYFTAPTLEQFASGTDYNQLYILNHVVDEPRAGAELLLAWVMSVSHLSGVRAFMPAIVAVNAVLVNATCAMVWRFTHSTKAAVLTGLLLAVSALSNLAVFQELMGQVLGLTLLIGAIVLIFHPFWIQPWRQLALEISAFGLMCAGLVIVYPEVSPFLVLALIVYVALAWKKKQIKLARLLAGAAGALAVALVTVSGYVPAAVDFLLYQIGSSGEPKTAQAQTALFPAFLLPSGLANFWGFQTIGSVPNEPWASLTIALGGLLLLGAAAASVWLAWKGFAAAIVSAVMLAFGTRLFAQHVAFGLFKNSMYVQPFVIATLVVAWLCLTRGRTWKIELAPLVVLGLAGLTAQGAYTGIALGEGATNIVPKGSESHLVEQFSNALRGTNGQPVDVDTDNVVIAKLQASAAQGQQLHFPSQNFFPNVIGGCGRRPRGSGYWVERTRALNALVCTRLIPEEFPMLGQDKTVADEFQINTFAQPTTDTFDCQQFIETGDGLTVFNAVHQTPAMHQRDFTAQRCNEVANHLVFVDSQLGHTFYTAFIQLLDPRSISLHQLEVDPLVPDQTFAAVGRYLLFQVVNPTQNPRLVLHMTDTYKGDGQDTVAPAAAIGASREPFPVVGRGSARVVSPPVTPLTIDGRAYLAIDMGMDGARLPERKEGLMQLYGRDLPVDARYFVAWVRDISLISEGEYQSTAPPSSVSAFPADLKNPGLQYSGIYEDGWVSEHAYFRLSQPGSSGTIRLRGNVPNVGDGNFKTDLKVLVDGRQVADQALSVGDFDLSVPAAGAPGAHTVELQFGKYQVLPHGDGRPVGALLRHVGFGS